MGEIVKYVKQPTWIDTLDPFFCHWFVGFTDGEGSFMIRKKTKRGSFSCEFQIEVRRDDKCALIKILNELKIGVYVESNRTLTGNRSPSCKYRVTSQEGCLKLCELFSYYQLRSKKANDFLIWREAVYKWIAHKPRESWDDMRELYEELKISRNYIEVESCEV